MGGLPLRGATGHRAFRCKPRQQTTVNLTTSNKRVFSLQSLADATYFRHCVTTALLFLISFTASHAQKILMGAEQLDVLLPKLGQQRVALLVNHTATIGKTHLVDSLQKRGVAIQKIFSPEHGFRGDADAGETVKDGTDAKTGLPVVSLYGSNKKPTAAQLADVDIVIFDIQDVGVRFYTYISSLHYLMEACAEQNKKVIVLDRPNPHGNMIDGPILDPALKSFVGMHPIHRAWPHYCRICTNDQWRGLAGRKEEMPTGRSVNEKLQSLAVLFYSHQAIS
jgi:hypothetical protein